MGISKLVFNHEFKLNIQSCQMTKKALSQGLLGDKRVFKLEYENVISRGNRKDGTARDRELAISRSKALRDRCAPHFLRREKKDILKER